MNYEKLLSEKAAALKPSGIRKFFSLAAERKDVISLGVGEPDFKTPLPIRQAAIRNLEEGNTKYTANAGLAELQKEICNYLSRRFQLEYATSQVIVTVGGSEAIDLGVRALINPGDEVLVPEPSFVCYTPIVQLAQGVSVPLVTREEDNFRLTAETLKAAITPKTKLLILPYPNNPTGGIMRKEHLEEIAEVLRGTDIMVLSDEIYADLTYGGKHVSIASLPGMMERTILVNGFSKAYAMTGWRLGYVAAPQAIIDVIYKIHQFAIMCAPTTSQHAAIVAMRECDGDVEEMNREYDRRRKMVVKRLNDMGLHCFDPQGAFYVFPSIQSTGLSSQEFCLSLLDAKNVAVVPGDAFGESGDGFVRICYAYSTQHLEQALDRIEEYLQELKAGV